MQSRCCDDASDTGLIEINAGYSRIGLQLHSGVTLFVSIVFNESCITSVIVALTMG